MCSRSQSGPNIWTTKGATSSTIPETNSTVESITSSARPTHTSPGANTAVHNTALEDRSEELGREDIGSLTRRRVATQSNSAEAEQRSSEAAGDTR